MVNRFGTYSLAPVSPLTVAAGLEVAGLEVADLEVAGLEVAGLEVGLEVAGLVVRGTVAWQVMKGRLFRSAIALNQLNSTLCPTSHCGNGGGGLGGGEGRLGGRSCGGAGGAYAAPGSGGCSEGKFRATTYGALCTLLPALLAATA